MLLSKHSYRTDISSILYYLIKTKLTSKKFTVALNNNTNSHKLQKKLRVFSVLLDFMNRYDGTIYFNCPSVQIKKDDVTKKTKCFE